jgi:hypothetical protein
LISGDRPVPAPRARLHPNLAEDLPTSVAFQLAPMVTPMGKMVPPARRSGRFR